MGCTPDSGIYRLCMSYRYDRHLCAEHDPPILDQDDCAREVAKLVDAGICKAKGYFSGTFCHPQIKTACWCEYADGPGVKWYDYEGRDILQLKSGFDPCDVENGGCDENAECDSSGDAVTCKCMAGYEGTGETCEKINPCDHGNGGCVHNARCENDDGVALCFCNSGLVGDPRKLCEPREQCIDDPIFDVLHAGKYISGGYCGDQTPGDRKYGECEAGDSRYRLCNSYSTERDLCAKHDPPILSQADCAREVQKLVDVGICGPEGIFDSTLCNDDEKTSCVCQTPNSVRKWYSNSGKDMYQLKSGVPITLEQELADEASMEAEDALATLVEDGTSYTNLMAAAFISLMFIFGYTYGSYQVKQPYSPLLDAKTIEMQ